jgi:hypothetical protein
LRGYLLNQVGKPNEAVAVLSAACAQAQQCGADGTEWRIWQTLAEVQTQRGELAAAAHAQTNAQRAVQSLAETLPPDLQPSFLNQPRIRAVFRDL